MPKSLMVGLTASQIAVVCGVFVFTLVGAIGVALAFRWSNARTRVREQLRDIRES